MSRVGKAPITIPSGVTVNVDARDVTVNGPKGTLSLRLPAGLGLEQSDSVLSVRPIKDTPEVQGQYGLTRTLVANMVSGTSEGFSKQLEINGVGYRVQVSGKKITLNLGYSHPLEYLLPENVDAALDGNTLTISGIDKQLVGQVAAHIREMRKPEPYKGKGIKYKNERIIRKQGKAAGK